MESLNPSYLLRQARHKAGLTQRELAKRADTSPSLVARIESGATSPTIATLNRLLHSSGFELDAQLKVRPVSDSHMLKDISRILQLTPEERLEEVENTDSLIKEARHA